MGYKYYDTPIGEDIGKKLLISTKISGAAALMASTADVMLYSYPKGYMQTLGRYVYITGPLVTIAATFTITSNLLASMRKKDDRLNYFLGGVAAGTILGTWRKSLILGFVSGIGFGVLGVVKKDSVDEGWEFFPRIKPQLSGINTQAYNYTLTEERPRNWTTGK